jgi:hypothetical protein
MTDDAAATIEVTPAWRIAGEWFDVCSCNVPCPCTFAQAPTGNHCEVLFAYRINEGHYGTTPMQGLKVVILATLPGNLWNGMKLDAGVFFDAAADADQRQALVTIFTGKAGGWMTQFMPSVREVKGVEFADISVEVETSLEHWNVKVADQVDASGVALTGPTADPTKRVQSFNPPGSEVGPTNAAVTWGKAAASSWKAFGAFDVKIPAGQSSKHIPFDWSGPDAA